MNTSLATRTKPAPLPTATLLYSNSGAISGVRIDGHEHRVVEAPRRWYERVPRWWMERGLRLEKKGDGAGVVDRQVMQLETRRGGQRSTIETLELVRSRDGVWRLREVLRAS